MPTYEYLCSHCGYEFEIFQAMSDEPIRTCPHCNLEVRRLVSGGTGLIFKGSGFYLTDYKNKSTNTNTNNNKTVGKSKNETITTPETKGTSTS